MDNHLWPLDHRHRGVVPPVDPPRDEPFTVAQARSRGISRTMLEGKRYRRLLVGVHIRSDVPLSLWVWLQAAFLVLPADATVTHVTGLHVRGVHVGPPWPLRFVSTHRRQVRRPRLRVSRALALAPRRGRLASAEHCFVASCVDLDLVDAVTAGDWLLHRGHVTLDALRAYVAASQADGSVLARRAVLLVRARVESPRETYVRLLLVLAGLPEPRCNVDLGVDLSFIGRADLLYAEYRVVVEYDGRQHALDADQWERDLDRLDGFDVMTWGHVRVTAQRLRRPREVVRQVYARLVAGGYRGPAPVFGPEWTALFESRTAADRARESASADSWSR